MSRPGLKPTQPLLQMVPGFFSGGEVDCGLKLTIHIRRVPRLKMSGAKPPLCAFFTWTVTRVPSPFISVAIDWMFLPAQ
jgi:hypothetical protein